MILFSFFFFDAQKKRRWMDESKAFYVKGEKRQSSYGNYDNLSSKWIFFAFFLKWIRNSV
jgi:hypothetical protein